MQTHRNNNVFPPLTPYASHQYVCWCRFATSCSATPYATFISTRNPRIDTVTDLATNKVNGYYSGGTPGQFGCMPMACQTGVTSLTGVANQAVTATCNAAANNNGGVGATTMQTSGFVLYAQYLVSHSFLSSLRSTLHFHSPAFHPTRRRTRRTTTP
jgi:hypothetical protein